MEELLESLEELYEMLFYGLGIAEMGVAGVSLVTGLIVMLATAVFGLMVSLLVFVLQAVPLYKISKKMGRKSAWLVWLSWLPIVGSYIGTYVLADTVGEKPVKLLGNVKIENRLLSFWIYIGAGLFGAALITALIGVVNIIPGLGQVIGAFSATLYLVPPVAVAWLEYAYLRDVLDLFNPDRKNNNIAAIVVAVLDALVTFGLARAFYLYTVMNKDPLPQQVIDAQ